MRRAVRLLVQRIVWETDTRAGAVFDWAIQALVVVSLVTFALETSPNLSEEGREWLRVGEIVVVAIFTAEYLARVWTAQNRLRFICSFFGVVDLLAILPFYLSLGMDLRSIRVVRLLRVFRALKLARYSAAIGRFRRALVLAKEELVLFGVSSAMVLYLAAVGIYYFEHEAQPEKFPSIFAALWWAVATLTTVGYGDVYPVTVGGRVFTFLVLVVGLGIVSVPSGIVASALQSARADEGAGDQR